MDKVMLLPSLPLNHLIRLVEAVTTLLLNRVRLLIIPQSAVRFCLFSSSVMTSSPPQSMAIPDRPLTLQALIFLAGDASTTHVATVPAAVTAAPTAVHGHSQGVDKGCQVTRSSHGITHWYVGHSAHQVPKGQGRGNTGNNADASGASNGPLDDLLAALIGRHRLHTTHRQSANKAQFLATR
jgi:hypothetical protein